jgi:hypothetical protein
MKNAFVLISIVTLCGVVSACKKSSTLAPVPSSSSLSFFANDTLISFPVNQAFIQDITTTQTTLISGQYADTSTRQGSISIRLIGDTTGRYSGDSLLVTYTNPAGLVYNSTGDGSSFVQVDKFAKTSNGIVSGSFSLTVSNGSGSLQISKGVFTALYQD